MTILIYLNIESRKVLMITSLSTSLSDEDESSEMFRPSIPRNLPGGKRRPAHRADNLTANC
jgi:hypothetical protein